MNKLVVVLGAVAALSLVGGVSVKANALTFKELIGKVKEGAKNLVRGNGDIKAHLERVKKQWAEWKEKASGLAKKAKAKWAQQQKKIQAMIKKIAAQKKKVQVALLQKLKDARENAKKWLEAALAKAGGKKEAAPEKKAE